MARQNYGFQKRQKELAKQKKKELKRQKKLEKNAPVDAESLEGEEGSGDDTGAAESEEAPAETDNDPNLS